METDEILHKNDNALLIVRRDDLVEFATTYANQVLAGLPKPNKKQEIEKPITQAEAIEYLGKSRQTLIQWRKKGIIHGYLLGGRVYYLKSELLAALKQI